MSSSTDFNNFLEKFACAHVNDGFMDGDGERMLGHFMNLQGSPLLEVKELKEKGNFLFRQNHFNRAATCYDEACKLLGLSIDVVIGGGDAQSVSDLAISLNSNLAACALKLEEYQATLDLCTMILDSFPRNVKALFRRAIAFMKLKRFSEAELDLLQALMVEPRNKDILRELDVAQGHLLIKENGKRVLERVDVVDVDTTNKKQVQVSDSSVSSMDVEVLESVSMEVANNCSNCGMISGIREKDNGRVNMEVLDDVSVCGTGLDINFKNKQDSIKPIVEFSKKGGGNSRLRIPGQAYQKLLDGKELSFYQKRNMSVITIRVLNGETTNKGGTTKEFCNKIKKRRRSSRRGRVKPVIEETPSLDITCAKPLDSSSCASSLGDNFTSQGIHISHVPLSNPTHDSNWDSTHLTDNTTSFRPKPQFGSNEYQPSVFSTCTDDHQPSSSLNSPLNSPVECKFSFSVEDFQCGPSTHLFRRYPWNHQVKEKKRRRIINVKKDYSKGDESPRHILSTCSSSRSLFRNFLRPRGVSVSCCRYSSEAQLIKKRKETCAHLAKSDRPLKKPTLFITPTVSLVSFSNNVIIKPDSESRVCLV